MSQYRDRDCSILQYHTGFPVFCGDSGNFEKKKNKQTKQTKKTNKKKPVRLNLQKRLLK